MCIRKRKAETGEVCLIYVISRDFIELLSPWTYFSERGHWIDLLRPVVLPVDNCAIVCGSRVTTIRFLHLLHSLCWYVLKWIGLFLNEHKTEQESLVFVKRMMAVAVSSITYLRGIFPEDAYRSRYLEGETQRQHHIIMVTNHCMSHIVFCFNFQTCVSKFCVRTAAALVQTKLWSGEYCSP